MFFKFPLMYHQDFVILIIGVVSFNYFTVKVYCSIADKTDLCVCLWSKEKKNCNFKEHYTADFYRITSKKIVIGCFFRYMYFLFTDWTPLFADCFLLNKTMKIYILSVLLFTVVFSCTSPILRHQQTGIFKINNS